METRIARTSQKTAITNHRPRTANIARLETRNASIVPPETRTVNIALPGTRNASIVPPETRTASIVRPGIRTVTIDLQGATTTGHREATTNAATTGHREATTNAATTGRPAKLIATTGHQREIRNATISHRGATIATIIVRTATTAEATGAQEEIRALRRREPMTGACLPPQMALATPWSI